MTALPLRLLIHPLVPSILGPDVSEVPIAPISLPQHSDIKNVHVFPAHLDLDKLQDALAQLSRLYPLLGARVRRREAKRADGRPYNYYYELTNSPFEIAVVPAADPTLAYPFPSRRTLVETIDPYADSFSHAYFPDNDESLFGAKVTRFGTYDVLGITWAHILSDGAGLQRFTELLSRVYAGGQATEADWPDYGEHVHFEGAPSAEALGRWDTVRFFPPVEPAEVGRRWVEGIKRTEPVQFNLSAAEIKRLQELATGEGPDGFVTEQDAMTSYFLNLCRLQGIEFESVTNSVNYRSFFPSDPSFPPTLPRLVANVAQILITPLPPSALSPSAPTSLKPFAAALRASLTTLRSDPALAREWLSVASHRMGQAADAGKTQQWTPAPGEMAVNSNWRYKWNWEFGFAEGSTGFHTGGTIPDFLRVFEARGGGAELSWRLEGGKARRVLEEVQRDRRDNWERWE